MKSNFKRLLLITFSTAIFSVLLTVLMLYLFIMKPLPPSFKGIDERGIAFPLAMIVIFNLTLTTHPIYLNLFKTIREDIAYSSFSFFILPLILTFFAGSYCSFKETPLIAIFIGPFWLGLIANFYGYRLYIKKQLSKA